MNTSPAEYTINVQNHSGQPRTYFLYPATPLINPWPDGGIHRCIQIAAPKVSSPKGSILFSLNMRPYAVTGTSSKSLGSGVRVDVRGSRRAQICTMDALGDVVKTSAEGNAWRAGFGEVTRGCETLGSFSIEADGGGQGGGSGEFIASLTPAFTCYCMLMFVMICLTFTISLRGPFSFFNNCYINQLNNPSLR